MIGHDIHRNRQKKFADTDNILASVQHDFHHKHDYHDDGDGNASSTWNMFDTSIWNND